MPAKAIVEILICAVPTVAGIIVTGISIREESVLVSIDSDFLVITLGKQVIATCCLEFDSIPGSVNLDENDRPKYNTAMLLAMRAGMDSRVTIAFEAGVTLTEPYIRIFITAGGHNYVEIKELLRKEATRIEAILLASLRNAELHQLKGESLRTAVTSVFDYDFLHNKEIKSEMGPYRSLAIIKGAPCVTPSTYSSQIGVFLSTALKQGYSATLTCVFSASKAGKAQKKMEREWREIRSKEIRMEDSLLNQATKKKLLSDYEKIQGDSGWFDVSVCISLKETDESSFRKSLEGIKGVVFSIWDDNGSIKLDEKSVTKRIGYRLLTRRHLGKQKLHANWLAAYVNTPIQSMPVLTMIQPPEFTIPPKELVSNELSIGRIVYGGRLLSDVGLKVEWLKEHIAVLGATGTGKTTLVKKLIAHLSMKTEIPWWIFDVKGSEYADLPRNSRDDVYVLQPGLDSSFVIDLMDPESDSVERHAHVTFAILSELLKERHSSSELSPAMEKLLREAILDVAQNKKKENSIQALVETVKKNASNDRIGSMTRDALLNRLEILYRDPLGSILRGGSKAVRISDLLSKRVVFDMSHVARTGGMEAARLLYNLVAKRIFDYAMRRGIRPNLHHVVVLEEASNLVPESYSRYSAADVTTGESMVMLQRATGQGVIVISTRPNISSNILANTATKISFRLPYDSTVGGRFMSLDNEQERYLRTLKRGRALITMPGIDAFEFETSPIDEFDQKTSIQSRQKVIEDTQKIVDEPKKAVYDKLGELASHVVAFLASRNMATQEEIDGLLNTLNPHIHHEDISELIHDLISLGTIDRESLALVPGGFVFALPGQSLIAVKAIIIDYIANIVGSSKEMKQLNNTPDGPDMLVDNQAIMIIPEHLKTTSMKDVIDRIRRCMNKIGNEITRLIVIVRGSVGADKLRENMDSSEYFESVNVLPAFPSSLDMIINGFSSGTSLATDPTQTQLVENSSQLADTELIGAMHDVGSATSRAIQLRLWFRLIQDFIEISQGQVCWNLLLEFIATTALQSLKGRSAPMSKEEGQRALTELLADEVLVAIRIGEESELLDLEPGLWVINSSVLKRLKEYVIETLEKALQRTHQEVFKNHECYDLCAKGISYVIFPTQQQLNTLLNLNSKIACRTCSSKRVVCILTASEYLEESAVVPPNLCIKAFDEGPTAVLN